MKCYADHFASRLFPTDWGFCGSMQTSLPSSIIVQGALGYSLAWRVRDILHLVTLDEQDLGRRRQNHDALEGHEGKGSLDDLGFFIRFSRKGHSPIWGQVSRVSIDFHMYCTHQGHIRFFSLSGGIG